MNNDQLVWPYWSVDLPGLSEVSALRLLAWVESEGVALGGTAIDPSASFSVHMDDDTVESLQEALELALQSKTMPAERLEIVRGFAHQLADWLSGRPTRSNPN